MQQFQMRYCNEHFNEIQYSSITSIVFGHLIIYTDAHYCGDSCYKWALLRQIFPETVLVILTRMNIFQQVFVHVTKS